MAKKFFSFSIDTERDADILECLANQPNRSAFIRDAIRKALVSTSPPLDAAMARKVVDAALADARGKGLLVQQNGQRQQDTTTTDEEDPELGALLDNMF